MAFSDLFHQDLIEIGTNFSSQNDMFEKMFDKLYKNNYVKESFKEAIIKREKEYPTGLYTDKISLAIPHTDIEHVKHPFIYVIKLEKPLQFVQMGTNNEWVEVDNIFMLGIKYPSEQVDLLAQIMDKLQDNDFSTKFTNCESLMSMENLLKKTFRSEE